ncbi:MAG: hypothetical protein JRF20_09740 [Deltaproteobacteria bacterium]|nr:hypothetical protein [Deltaproteobacteria bacterium]MBW1937317.1 hypothetical protein [Deltaproteobacteria bacterium]MBW1964387.1 hypothetical protein [Deltaproteobacteria bacterium]MBW2080722.1 hypothetical protein [Deltaproteobacteria bacterium]MBW2351452.1 hypothetical protein [Deltaproteobacteria bacterium]
MFLGKISLLALLGGVMGGMTIVYLYWQVFLITGVHGKIAFVMIAFIILGGTSGLYMDLNKKKRTALPLIHGLSNLVLLILALAEVVTGWRVYTLLVLEN